MDFRGNEWVLVGHLVYAAMIGAAAMIFVAGLLVGWWLL